MKDCYKLIDSIERRSLKKLYFSTDFNSNCMQVLAITQSSSVGE